MSTHLDIDYKYPFDKTGKSVNNRVENETHEINEFKRIILPVEGVFFADSLIIKKDQTPLVRNVDYKVTFLSQEATESTNLECVGGIVIINPELKDRTTFTISYNVVGGKYSERRESIGNIKQIYQLYKPKARWEDVKNIPTQFVPTPHLHSSSDIIGMGPTNQILLLMVEALYNQRANSNLAIWKQIGFLYTRQNEIMERMTEKTREILEIGERIKTFDMNNLVSKKTFDTTRTKIDTDIAAVSCKVVQLSDRVDARVQEITEKQTQAEADQTNLRQDLDDLRRDVSPSKFTINLNYTGQHQGYMSITRQPNADYSWNVEYTDSPELERINQNVSSVKERLDDLVTTVGDVTTNLNDSKLKVEALTTLPLKVNELKSEVDNIKLTQRNDKSDLEGQITDLQRDLGEQVRNTNLQLNNLADGLPNRLNEMLTTIRGEVTTVVENQKIVNTNTDNKIQAITTRVDELRRDVDQFNNGLVDRIQEELTKGIDNAVAGELTTLKSDVQRTNEVVTRVDNQLTTVNDRLNQLTDDKLTDKISTATNSVKTELTNRIQAHETKHEQDINNLRQGITTAKSEAVNEARTLVDNLNTSTQNRFTELTRNVDEAKAQVTSVRNEIITTKLPETLNQAKDYINQLEGRINTRLDGFDDLVEEKVTEAEEAIQTKIDDLKDYVDTQDLKVVSWVRDQFNGNSIIDFEHGDQLPDQQLIEKPGHHGGKVYYTYRGNQREVPMSQKYPYDKRRYYRLTAEVLLSNEQASATLALQCFDGYGNRLTLRDVCSNKTSYGVIEQDTPMNSNEFRIRSVNNFNPNGLSRLNFYAFDDTFELNKKAAAYVETSNGYSQTTNKITLKNTVPLSVRHQIGSLKTNSIISETTQSTESVVILKKVSGDATNVGKWITIEALVPPGWFSGDQSTMTSNGEVFYGTTHVVPTLILNNESSPTTTEVSYANVCFTPAEAPVDLTNIPGLDDAVYRSVSKLFREQQNLPVASRWDLDRFIIQPGTESFSSVSVDNNDNLTVRGVVYYDVNGVGDRGLFSPTARMDITSSQAWIVPQAFHGRTALIRVRANAKVDGTNIVVSATREIFYKLEGGTTIAITCGDITSVGSILTVSNGTDYADAVFPRMTIPNTGNNINNLKAMVTIYA